MFGREPVDFETQIAELNATAARRRGIRAQIKRAKDVTARIAAWVKANPKKKIVVPKAALRKEPPPDPTRLKEMVQDFYEPEARNVPPDPWDEDAKELKQFRAKIAHAKRQKKPTGKMACPKPAACRGPVWAEAEKDYARSESRRRFVTLVVLPLLALGVLLFVFERHNILEIGNGEIVLSRVTWFGACEREVRRLPIVAIASVDVAYHTGGGRHASSSFEVRIRERTGAPFYREPFSGFDDCGRANRESRRLKEALRGHAEYRSRKFYRSGLAILSAALLLVAFLGHKMSKAQGAKVDA